MADDEINEETLKDTNTANEESWEEPVKAWEKDDKSEKEMPVFNSSYDIIIDYSGYSTIQGLIYIFFVYQTTFGKIFWAIVILLMVILGLYWIIKAYVDWKEKPVLTTVTTTAYAVDQVEFPAVTICSPGMSYDLLITGLLKLYFKHLDINNSSMGMTPLEAINLINMDTSVMSASETAKRNKLTKSIGSDSFGDFLNASYPGLTLDDNIDDIIDFLKLLTSKNPDADVAAIVAYNGGYDPCAQSNYITGTKRRRKRQVADTIKCAPGFIIDTTTNYCYQIFPDVDDYYNAWATCYVLEAELLIFDSDGQVTGLINLLKKGNLTLPSDLTFFVDAMRDPSGNFEFYPNPIQTSFTNLIFQNDTYTKDCLVGKYVSGSPSFNLYERNCLDYSAIVCRKYADIDYTCTGPSTFKKEEPFNLILDPSLQIKNKQAKNQKTQFFRDMYARLDRSKSFKTIFSNLWYATLPCFDIRGVTAEKDGDTSILKYCEWKGEPVPCSAIFRAFPTDQGICCAFNIREADEILKGDTYPGLVKELQTNDKNMALKLPILPKSYKENKEPRTLPGRNKGLVLILDLHSDLLAPGSVDTDYKGFFGLVGPRGNFPFTQQEGFQIRPGHNNMIALTGTKIDSEEDLRKLAISDRKCLFPDENDMLLIHRNYTYTNCMFECALLYGKSALQEYTKSSYSCTPWYFPSPDDTITVCNPWEAVKFLELALDYLPEGQCSYCYADCSTTVYDSYLSTIPFRRCDIYNLGVSPLCKMEDAYLPDPKKFGGQILAEFPTPKPGYLNRIIPTQRTFARTIGGDTFTQNPKTYEAYDEDIAMVQIYFKKSSVFQMGSQPRMTWIDYLSNVGGLLGLVLGMGIVSFIELIWLCLRLGARKWNLTHWIR